MRWLTASQSLPWKYSRVQGAPLELGPGSRQTGGWEGGGKRNPKPSPVTARLGISRDKTAQQICKLCEPLNVRHLSTELGPLARVTDAVPDKM